MAALSVSSELDAAEALLALQRDHHKTKYEKPRDYELKDNSLPMATFLYNLIGSRSSLGGMQNNTSTPKTSPVTEIRVKSEPNSLFISKTIKKGNNIPKTTEAQCISHDAVHNYNLKCNESKKEAIITKVWSDNLNERRMKHTFVSKTMQDKSTQTELEYQVPEIEKMEKVIRGLCSKIETLENRLKSSSKKSESSSLIDSVTDRNTDASNDELCERVKITKDARNSHKRKRTSTINTDIGGYCNSTSENATFADLYKDEMETDKEYSNNKILKPNGNNRGKSDMVSIGEGNAVIPSKIMKNMDWTSYTNATRKLLTAVFSRTVLATHSLTGKPSPAFPDKPAKKKLNSSLVNDIVQTVVEKCHVPESVVRTSITTKCADESKMFRSRQQNKKKRTAAKRNRENIPPYRYDTEDSNDSYLSS